MLSPVPMIPPVTPINAASLRNILSSWPRENPLVKKRPISLRLRLNDTSETVVPMYQAIKKTGRAVIRNCSLIVWDMNRKLFKTFSKWFSA